MFFLNKILSFRVHPLTSLFIAASFFVCVLNIKSPLNLFLASIGAILASFTPTRSYSNPFRAFARVTIFALTMLFLIHGLNYSPPSVNLEGIKTVCNIGIRLVSIFSIVLWLEKTITKEEFFALMITLNIPVPIILLMFRTFWFIPQISKRVEDVLIVQRLKGIDTSNFLKRFLAVTPAVQSVFGSIVLEISDCSAALASKGLGIIGKKTHLTKLEWSFSDVLAFVIVFVLIVFTLTVGR